MNPQHPTHIHPKRARLTVSCVACCLSALFEQVVVSSPARSACQQGKGGLGTWKISFGENQRCVVRPGCAVSQPRGVRPLKKGSLGLKAQPYSKPSALAAAPVRLHPLWCRGLTTLRLLNPGGRTR
jgi:hypothetical protein